MESNRIEQLNTLKETLKKCVDELLSFRNRLAEYDSEFINQFDEIELDLNRLYHLKGEEKSSLTKKLSFDCNQFAERISAITSNLTIKVEEFRNDFDRFTRELMECNEGCSANLKTTLGTLLQIYKENLDVILGMEVIFARYSSTLKEKTEQVKN